MTTKHLMYVPFTGLGLFGGFRGNRWLKNRLKVFEEFVIPSLRAQTVQDFMLWISWRPEEKSNPIVQQFVRKYPAIIHTFTGVCFYDDKYEPTVARARLLEALHGAAPHLMNAIGECDTVLMTIQPSDDCYIFNAVEEIQALFQISDFQAVGYNKGYICDYTTKQVAEYNPTTNPPFYTLKFPREVFVDARAHLDWTALKHDVPGYPAGTPLPSHEWVGDCLKYAQIDKRGFLVGTHGANISTTWQIPFKGDFVHEEVLKAFGLYHIPPLEIKYSIANRMFIKLPHKAQRKIRYWAGEKDWVLRPVFGKIYNILRS